MEISVDKIPGGLRVDGLDLKGGKCGCTSILSCCHSWTKIKRNGNNFTFTGKATSPDTKENFNWAYTVKKGDYSIEVKMEDARDKVIFSGYYPPRLEDWLERGWELVIKEGEREDFDLWRCAACKWLYKERVEGTRFIELPDDWRCPVCKAGKASFEKVG